MLRAIAKIEVIDRIGATGDGDATIQPDPADRASIDKVAAATDRLTGLSSVLFTSSSFDMLKYCIPDMGIYCLFSIEGSHR